MFLSLSGRVVTVPGFRINWDPTWTQCNVFLFRSLRQHPETIWTWSIQYLLTCFAYWLRYGKLTTRAWFFILAPSFQRSFINKSSRVAIGPKNRDIANHLRLDLFLLWAKTAFMSANVPQPTLNLGIIISSTFFPIQDPSEPFFFGSSFWLLIFLNK